MTKQFCLCIIYYCYIEKSNKNLKYLVTQIVINFCPPGFASVPGMEGNSADS